MLDVEPGLTAAELAREEMEWLRLFWDLSEPERAAIKEIGRSIVNRRGPARRIHITGWRTARTLARVATWAGARES